MQKFYNVFRMEMSAGSILGYFLQAIPVALIVGIAYAVVRVVWLKRQRIQIDWKSEVVRWLFACYLTGLCSLVVLPANFWLYIYDGIFYGWWDQLGSVFQLGEFNFIPAIVRYFNGTITLGSWVKQMLVGNIAMLVPFGLFSMVISEKCTGKKAFAIAVIMPIIMEMLQLIFGRSFDIDDIICNFLGIVLGFLIALGIKKTGMLNKSKSGME